MTAAVDSIAALRTFLLADTDTAALVGVRVFGDLPAAQAKNMPRASVVVKAAGGFGLIGQGNAEYGDSRVDTLCYGSTMYESYKVYLAVYGALKRLQRQKVSGVLLHWAQPLSKGTTGEDPEKQWPVTLASWHVLASEIVAA